MALIESVSTLSIKRAINLYTVILFLSFGVLLYWLGVDRYQTFINTHEDKAKSTTKLVAFEISKTLKEKQRILDIFVESSMGLITELSNDPGNGAAHQQLSERLKRFQPDFFSFNIITLLGDPIISDLDSDISELCLEDIKSYIADGEQHIRLHPNKNEYHYDIKSTYLADAASQIFFVSFKVDEISEILGSVQSENHNLLLINKEVNNSIEITPEGSRKSISGRLDYKMTGDENFRVLSATKIKGTDWHVVDMRSEGLFTKYRNKTITEFVIAYYIFVIIVLFMRSIILKQDAKRTLAEEQLQENHQKIIELNGQLDLLSKTDSLTTLFNRRYFQEIITREWNRGMRSGNTLSCVLFDVDYFKYYNDYYGHQAGDKCLKEISVLLKDSFGRATDAVARYGGEEFIVVMADSSIKDTIAAIEHFQSELNKLNIPHETAVKDKVVTVSAGFVNQIASRDKSIDEFIRKADEALYLAKAEGRNKWVMYSNKY